MNYHKQGEHIFNNFVRTIENVKDIAIKELRMSYPEATKEIFNNAYNAHIGDIERHPLIVEGRKLKSESSGEQIDMNSQSFGIAASNFQQAMSDMARSIVKGFGNPDRHKGDAISAWRQMAQAGIDHTAYQRLLQTSSPGDRAKIDIVYRRFIAMLQHDFPLLGRDIITTIAQDIK